jgi:hypothetical protein
MADFANANPRTMALMRALGLLPSAPAQAPAQTPNPFSVPYTGLRNAPTDAATFLPPYEQPGAVANKYMPPLAMPQQSVTVPATPPLAAPPVTVSAPAEAPMPPRQSAADYGPAWNTPAAPGKYDHLNPTPSLESAFRQQYAADPNGFGKDNPFARMLSGLLG